MAEGLTEEQGILEANRNDLAKRFIEKATATAYSKI